MLILKEMIKLQTIRPTAVLGAALSVSADGGAVDPFYQRITENYSIIGMSFTPENLLFLMNSPPEAPEPAGGMTRIALQENINNTRDFTLNVLNNIVNRVLYSDNSRLTYQDEVYISSALRRLGITDVALFLRQVSNLREENRNIYNLLQNYRESTQSITYSPGEGSDVTDKPEKPRTPDSPSQAEEQRYTLHNEIYKRLKTAENYAIVHNFSKNYDFSSFISAAELHTAEQWRVSNLLALSEINQQFGAPSAELNHIHFNQYELGGLLPPPQTERQVIEQGAAGVLLNIIDNAMTARITQLMRNEAFWLDLRQAVYGAAERSLSRFQFYHTEYSGTRRVVQQIMQREAVIGIVRQLEAAAREHVSGDGGEPEAEEEKQEAAEHLKERLDEFDRRNRAAAERLVQQIQKIGRPAEAQPDITKIMTDSLKALENPDKTPEELLSLTAEMVHTPALPPETEAVLAAADETTRVIYESLLRHARKPEAEINEIHSQLSVFNAEVREIERQQTTELTHRADTLRGNEEIIRQNTETVMEHFRTVYAPDRAESPGAFRGPVRRVHRVPEQQASSEELVSRILRQQNDERRETVNREISEHRTVTETQINNEIQEQSVKSTEEITELVNNSIARQMNVISERVYNQMERRLSLERARRGK